MDATLSDLAAAFTNRCGVSPEQITVLDNPTHPSQVGHALAEVAEEATDALLFYYVGHGLVSIGGSLYLAMGATDRRAKLLPYTALHYDAVRDSLQDSIANSVIVILDCCFSGRALGVLAGDDAEDEPAELARVTGGCVLVASARNELAMAPAGDRYTAFSGELLHFLNNGDQLGRPNLTLRDAYRHLASTLPSKGFPRPRRRVSEDVDELVLAPNPSYKPPVRDDWRMVSDGSVRDVESPVVIPEVAVTPTAGQDVVESYENRGLDTQGERPSKAANQIFSRPRTSINTEVEDLARRLTQTQLVDLIKTKHADGADVGKILANLVVFRKPEEVFEITFALWNLNFKDDVDWILEATGYSAPPELVARSLRQFGSLDRKFKDKWIDVLRKNPLHREKIAKALVAAGAHEDASSLKSTSRPWFRHR
ncbi:caspase family protein [Saccharothrix sp. AJ9571]|nr:caspase family protein [Saccharothrix sp. AJ9571]